MKNVQRFILCYSLCCLIGSIIGAYIGYYGRNGTFFSCFIWIIVFFVLVVCYALFMVFYYKITENYNGKSNK